MKKFCHNQNMQITLHMEIFKEIITAAITVIASGKNEVTEMLRKKQSMYKQRKKRRT